MTEQSKQKLDDIDETQISKTMTDIAERSQRLVQDFLSKNAAKKLDRRLSLSRPYR